MGNTGPPYVLPWPDGVEPPDVPKDMQLLAKPSKKH